MIRSKLILLALMASLNSLAFNVTFRVDMNNVSGFNTPEVNGSFNNWCGNCFQMADPDGDNIWEATTSLAAGTYQYKFSYDNWAGQETLLQGSSCTVTSFGFTNRQIVISSDIVLPIVCWQSCESCANAPVQHSVTFQVDMNGQTGFTTPEVNGSFNNWCGSCFQMSDTNGDGIWTATTTLNAGSYEFKFSHDNWAGSETLEPGSACTMTTDVFTNRVLNLDADTVLPVVCYGSCVACNQTVPQHTVTFQLDMTGQTGYTTPEVNGTFNGWCGNCFPMSDADGDGIWTASTTLEEGTYEYKFSYDNWAGQETLLEGTPCTVTNNGFTNRSLNLTSDITLPVVCWGSCNACQQVVTTRNVTFQLDMNGQTGFTTPEVNGTFNGWCGNCFAMSDADGDGIWSMTATIEEGSYEYKFSYDNWAGEEMLMEGMSCTITTNGFTNRSLTVANDTILPVVCWNACEACSVQPSSYSVTFRVDMSNVTGFTTPEVNGTFNGWCGNCFPMSDADGDNIWEATTMVEAGNYVFKYAYDNWVGQEYLTEGMSCTATEAGYTNRTLTVDGDIILPVVCWESCVDCSVTPPSYNVTFQVDMTNVTGFTTPEVNGSFNNWCGNCFQMSDIDGDGIWMATTQLAVGSYEFKFAFDNWLGQENLNPGLGCTVTNFGYTNRSLEVTGDTILPVVCWESCVACWQTPHTYSVTFQVDMNTTSGFMTPEVNGTFNNWCGSCFQMNDADGDGIWTATTVLDEGSYEFKYSYDNWSGQEQLEPGAPCTVTAGAFTNRFLNLTADTILPVTCFGTCSACQAPQPVNVTLTVDAGTAVSSMEVSGTFNGFCLACTPMLNTSGTHYSTTLALLPGVYEYRFTANGGAMEEVLSDDICTVNMNGIFLRTITVTEETTVAEVCWNTCAACPSSTNDVELTAWNIYPNPASQITTIQFAQSSHAMVQLMDATGRVLEAHNMNGASQFNMELNHLSSGLYYVRVIEGHSVVTKSIEIIK
jgi:1,4-alpha-glucan branching enzyme